MTKIVIDIPNYNLNDIPIGSFACGQVLKAVKNGKPYEERPTGHWIKESNTRTTDLYICSVCKRTIMLRKGADMTKYPFCHCGADMRVKNELN